MTKILGKTNKPKVLGADTHSVSLTWNDPKEVLAMLQEGDWKTFFVIVKRWHKMS